MLNKPIFLLINRIQVFDFLKSASYCVLETILLSFLQ